MLAHGNATGQLMMQQAHSSRPLLGSSSRRRHHNSRFAAAPLHRSAQEHGSNSRIRCNYHLAAHSQHRSTGLHTQQQQAVLLPASTASSRQPAVQEQQHWQSQPLVHWRTRQQQQLPRSVVASAAAAAAASASGPSSSDSSSATPQQQDPQQQQQQQGLDLPPLDLPPSRSAALWLNDLSDAELQQTAADWGYVQVGRPLPEGISLTALAETLPDQVFALDLSKALGYLGLSLGVMGLGYSYLWFWHSICPLWQQMLAWVVIGTGYYGVFQTAVDCAHFAFWPERPWIQDVLGALLMAPSLISYELFRLKYFNHLMCTNQLYEDLDAWHPLLPSDLAAMPAWKATLTALVMATPLKFFASIGAWFRSLEGFDLKLHPKATRMWVLLSWALPLGFVGAVWPALIAAGGFSGLVTYWLGPWLVFHCWTSVMSLIQHTGPHIPWAEEGLTYDQAQATINGTVSVQVPHWLEVLLHHSNHHLPAHVSISIPSYNLPSAQAYLQQRLGPYLTVATLNANLLRSLMTAWLVYDEQRQQYLNFDEAADLVEACKYQQQHEAQQQQQLLQQQASSSNAAAALESNDKHGAKAPVITAAISLEHLLGKKAATNGRGASNGQQEQLAGSSSGSSSSTVGAAGA